MDDFGKREDSGGFIQNYDRVSKATKATWTETATTIFRGFRCAAIETTTQTYLSVHLETQESYRSRF